MTIPAHGIIVPLLETAEDARRLVRSAKFPPKGNRGFGSPFAMERFGGVSMTEYLQQSNDALVTIVQIETKQALENVWATSFSRKASLAECQRRSTRLPKSLALIACSLDPLTLATTLVTQSSTMLCKVRIFRADSLLSPKLAGVSSPPSGGRRPRDSSEYP